MFKRFRIGSVFFASFVATLFMTIFLQFFSIDFIKLLGTAAAAQENLIFAIGFVGHFGLGFIYGVFYALFFEPLFYRLSPFICGLLFSLVPFALFYVVKHKNFETPQNLISKHESKISYQPCKGEGYYHHIQKKREKMGREVIDWEKESLSFPKETPTVVWVGLLCHLVFGVTLSLLYRPREPKIWCS